VYYCECSSEAQTVPDAERCRKASREGTSRCSKPEAGDKPWLPYLASDLRDGITGIGHQDAVPDRAM